MNLKKIAQKIRKIATANYDIDDLKNLRDADYASGKAETLITIVISNLAKDIKKSTNPNKGAWLNYLVLMENDLSNTFILIENNHISEAKMRFSGYIKKLEEMTNPSKYLAPHPISGRMTEWTPKEAYQICKKLRRKKGIPELESIIMKDPEWAYKYAYNVIDKRWPEAESIIMKDPGSAYKYAYFVIKKRFFEAEPYIMKDPYWAYEYACDILEKRWPEAESIIIKDPQSAHAYAKEFYLKIVNGEFIK